MLEELAEVTGGRYLPVKKAGQLAEVTAASRGAGAPVLPDLLDDQSRWDGHWVPIEVRHNAGRQIRARRGYFAVRGASAASDRSARPRLRPGPAARSAARAASAPTAVGCSPTAAHERDLYLTRRAQLEHGTQREKPTRCAPRGAKLQAAGRRAESVRRGAPDGSRSTPPPASTSRSCASATGFPPSSRTIPPSSSRAGPTGARGRRGVARGRSESLHRQLDHGAKRLLTTIALLGHRGQPLTLEPDDVLSIGQAVDAEVSVSARRGEVIRTRRLVTGRRRRHPDRGMRSRNALPCRRAAPRWPVEALPAQGGLVLGTRVAEREEADQESRQPACAQDDSSGKLSRGPSIGALVPLTVRLAQSVEHLPYTQTSWFESSTAHHAISLQLCPGPTAATCRRPCGSRTLDASQIADVHRMLEDRIGIVLQQHRMADLTVLADGLSFLADVQVVVAAEAAQGREVPEVVGCVRQSTRISGKRWS